MTTTVSTDIYKISETINQLKANIIETESTETLALSTYGYLGEIASYILRTSLVNIAELANEPFATRTKFEKNLIVHAIKNGVSNINAVPASVEVLLGFLETDITQLMNNNRLTIDKACKFYIEDFEFHLDYDIILGRSVLSNKEVLYTARYDVSITNSLSDIVNPYLPSPAIVNMEGKKYIFVKCKLRQVSYDSEEPIKLISSNIIDNKTFEFDFEDQLATFNVSVVENGVTTVLTPIYEGINTDSNLVNYCYYYYMDMNNIRVKFDSSSYMPGLNAQITVNKQTTKGFKGNFPYNKDLLVVLESENMNYRNATAILKLQTDSKGGKDRKTADELRKLLPKEALAKGIITTAKDLENYFNTINTSTNRVTIEKKVDNQFERSFYSYLLMKNSDGNVVPTNTIDLNISLTDFDSIFENVYVIKQGAHILYDRNTMIGKVVKNPTPEQLAAADFVYTNPFMSIINYSPMYIAYYMPLMDEYPLLYFKDINESALMQYISTNIIWRRNFLTDTNKYKLFIKLTQYIDSDLQLVKEVKDETGKVISFTTDIKIIAMLYNDEGLAYRYIEGFITEYDLNNYTYTFGIEMETNDIINEDNKIRIENVRNLGSGEVAYGYFSRNINANIYILTKFDRSYGLYGLDTYVPDIIDYTVCNIYTIDDGLNFYSNYSSNISSIVQPTFELIDGVNTHTGYNIKGMPVVKYDYSQSEESMQDIISILELKKAYMDAAIVLLENSFTIDLKLFNTYGVSKTYSISDNSLLDRVNIELYFKVKLIANVDKNVVTSIKSDIKEYIEDLNDLSSLHMPNLTTMITNNYSDSLEYIEFLGINNYGPGMQHLYRKDADQVGTVPEFLCIDIDQNTGEAKIHITVE